MLNYGSPHHTSRFPNRQRKGFTLIEMLIVIGIIAILAAVLFPVFQKVRENARAADCLSNYHQIGLAVQMYAQDDSNYTPANGGSFSGLISDCLPYTHSTAIFTCPDDFDRVDEGRAGSYRMASLYQNKPLSCGWTDPYNPSVIAEPTTTTLAYEAEKDFAEAPIVATYRHHGGTQILRFDGHAKWLNRVSSGG